MEFKKFNFSPEEGFCDSSFYGDTPENPREILQRQHNQTRDYINSMVDSFNCRLEGESGLEKIKAPDIEGVLGDNAFSQIKSLKNQLDNIALKEVPDNSIDESKIKNGGVTEEKIRDGAVSTKKLADDTVSPYASEALNLNGIPAEEYLPNYKASSVGVYKECLGKADSSYIFDGKTFGNKRYIKASGVIKSLDLLTGEEEITANITDIAFKDFFVKDDELFVFDSVYSSGKYILNIYKYSAEYRLCILEKSIDLTGMASSGYSLYKVAYNSEYIYFLMANQGYDLSRYYLYEINMSELNSSNELQPLGYTTYPDMRNTILACDDEVVLFGDTAVYNRDFENTVKLDFKAGELSGGNIFCEGANILIRRASDFSPRLIVCNALKDIVGFLWQDYIYARVEGYIVRSKIF